MADRQKFQVVFNDVVDGCVFGLETILQLMVYVTTLHAKPEECNQDKASMGF
jgi:hypothetical protein